MAAERARGRRAIASPARATSGASARRESRTNVSDGDASVQKRTLFLMNVEEKLRFGLNVPRRAS